MEADSLEASDLMVRSMPFHKQGKKPTGAISAHFKVFIV